MKSSARINRGLGSSVIGVAPCAGLYRGVVAPVGCASRSEVGQAILHGGELEVLRQRDGSRVGCRRCDYRFIGHARLVLNLLLLDVLLFAVAAD